MFGANIEESSIIVKRYVQLVCKQIADLKGKVFEINGLHVNFHFARFAQRHEKKMLANVSTKDCADLRGTFGSGPQCKWKPWVFEERIKNAERVESFKALLNGKPMSEKQKRTKVTEYIAGKKRRQEFSPLVEPIYPKIIFCHNISLVFDPFTQLSPLCSKPHRSWPY